MASDPEVLDALRGVVDPEVGVNIVDLGLVYRAERTADAIDVAMTMTTRACPLGEMMLEEARAALIRRFPDVPRIATSLVWEPRWTPAMMTEQGHQQLGI
jgi:metal-sulfur cluster biosynthetic enzyme